MKDFYTSGKVIKAFGNLIDVEFDGQVRLGESCFVFVGDTKLKAEVIEVCSTFVKVQVFESTSGMNIGDKVVFNKELIEVELGPGLLSSLYDGLQHPLHQISRECGMFLQPGAFAHGLDRERLWEFSPFAKPGDVVLSGYVLGSVKEQNLIHKIFVPFSLVGELVVESIDDKSQKKVTDKVAVLRNKDGDLITVTLMQKWPIKKPLLLGSKRSSKDVLETGCRSIDTQFPIAKGGTFCMPGPFGAGKTVLQQHIAKYSSIDVVVFAACGERAGEVVELIDEFPNLIDPHTGRALIERTILICNTSSMPVAARESSIYIAVTIGEYYRQMGLDVLVLADSTSRWAQAMREMSSRLEEIPGDEAFPVYLSSKIAELYQRSGCISSVSGEIGSLTIGGAVSPAGGNFDEPVTQSTLSVVGAFLGLSKARSDSRRYPAIDPLNSWSKYLHIASEFMTSRVPDWDIIVNTFSSLVRKGDDISQRIEVVGEDGISIEDFICYLKAELYDFVYLQQNSFDKEDAYCSLEKQSKMIEIMMDVIRFEFSELISHDECRSYFLNLQSRIKELAFMKVGDVNWDKQVSSVYDFLGSVSASGAVI